MEVNKAKMALVCDDRKTAIQLATSVGAPVLTRGMFKCKNLGGDVAPLPERRWRQTGSVFTQRLRKAARRAARLQNLRRKRKAVQNRHTPGLGVRDGTPRRIPSEMERVEHLAVRALSPSTKGVSRTAKLAYHQELVADAQIACTAQLLR